MTMPIMTPTRRGAAGSDPARVVSPGADGKELTFRWRSLAVEVIAPAGDDPVDLHSAGVGSPNTYGGELAMRWLGIATFVTAPTDKGTIGSYSARVEFPNTNG